VTDVVGGLIHPLQLTLEAREGEWVGEDLKHPLQLAFEAREGEGWWHGGLRLQMTPQTHIWGEGGVVLWVRTKNDPSDSHLKRERETGGGVVGEALKCPLRLEFEAREGERVVIRWVKP